jgi:outer membrane protein, heavy metal efflux system
MRTYFIFILILAGFACAKEPDPILERYITLALTQNPRISAAQNAAEAAKFRVPQAGALPSPMLNLGLKEMNINDGKLRYNDMSSSWISVAQEFPFPGTLAAKTRGAESSHQMSTAEADASRAELTLEVEMTYYQWAFWRGSMGIVEQSKELLKQTAEQLTAKYAAGISLQSDVLRAQMEIVKLDNTLSDLHQKEISDVANINICCALPPGTTTTPPTPLHFEPRPWSYDSLWALIQDKNPMARVQQAKIAMAEADVRMAELNYYPNFVAGVEYMRRGRGIAADNLLSVMGGVSLPLYWKKNQEPMLHEKQSELARAQEDAKNTLNDVRFQLTDNLSQTKNIEQQIANYETQLIPQAEQIVASARASYASGKLDFMDLLNHQMTLLDLQRDHLMKIMEYNMAWAKIEALTGQRLL